MFITAGYFFAFIIMLFTITHRCSFKVLHPSPHSDDLEDLITKNQVFGGFVGVLNALFQDSGNKWNESFLVFEEKLKGSTYC